MRAAAWTLIVWFCASTPLRADEASAKENFVVGAEAAVEGRWEAAEAAFKRSLTEEDKPATRYNLVLVSEALARPIEVLRHACAFLEHPRSHEHGIERERVAELMRAAREHVGVIVVEHAVDAAQLTIDGTEPVFRIDREVYVMPGTHALEAKTIRGGPITGLVTVRAGERLVWPPLATGSNKPPASVLKRIAEPLSGNRSALREAQPSWRIRAAWSLGVAGAAAALAAIACYASAVRRAEDLADADFAASGYPSASDRYLRMRAAVMPLAYFGGVAMSAAFLTSPHGLRRGTLAWSITNLVLGSALLGVGTALLVRTPEQIIPGVATVRPSREAGGLLTASALPLMTYGIGFQVQAMLHRGRLALVHPYQARW